MSDYTNETCIDSSDNSITVGNDRRGEAGAKMGQEPIPIIMRVWQYPLKAEVEVPITREEAIALGHWLLKKASQMTP